VCSLWIVLLSVLYGTGIPRAAACRMATAMTWSFCADSGSHEITLIEIPQ